MTYERAKADFCLFGVFRRRENRRGKVVLDEVEDPDSIPYDATGAIAIYDPYGWPASLPQGRLCFVLDGVEPYVPRFGKRREGR